MFAYKKQIGRVFWGLSIDRGYSLEGNTANLISESQTFSFDWMKLEMGQ